MNNFFITNFFSYNTYLSNILSEYFINDIVGVIKEYDIRSYDYKLLSTIKVNTTCAIRDYTYHYQDKIVTWTNKPIDYTFVVDEKNEYFNITANDNNKIINVNIPIKIDYMNKSWNIDISLIRLCKFIYSDDKCWSLQYIEDYTEERTSHRLPNDFIVLMHDPGSQRLFTNLI